MAGRVVWAGQHSWSIVDHPSTRSMDRIGSVMQWDRLIAACCSSVCFLVCSSIYSSACSVQHALQTGRVLRKLATTRWLLLQAAADHQAAEMHALHGGPSDLAALVGFDDVGFGRAVSVRRLCCLASTLGCNPFACLPDPAHRSVTKHAVHVQPPCRFFPLSVSGFRP